MEPPAGHAMNFTFLSSGFGAVRGSGFSFQQGAVTSPTGPQEQAKSTLPKESDQLPHWKFLKSAAPTPTQL